MRSVIRIIFISLTITTLTSCDLLDDLMNKNHFADVADTSSISLNETDFQNFNTNEEKVRVVDKYTSMALDPVESQKLFNALRVSLEEGDATINALTGLMDEQVAALDQERTTIENQINDLVKDEKYETNLAPLVEQYLSINSNYQRLNTALAKVHIYSRDFEKDSVIDGTQLALVGYESQIIKEKLDPSIIREYLLDIKDTTTQDVINTKQTKLENLIIGIDKGAEALKKIGESIIDRDSPKTPYLKEEDAAFVLLTLVIDKIIEDTAASQSTYDEAQIAKDLADDIIDASDYSSYIIFPNKMTVNNENYTRAYLGEYGELVFAATGYELPDAVLLEGGAK